jgi:hypothetical protein
MTRSLVIVGVCTACAIVGCGSRSGHNAAKPDPAKPAEPPVPLPEVIRTEAGESDLYTESDPRRKRWTVRWKSSELRPETNPGDKSPIGRGDFKGVTGTLYDARNDQVVSSRFSADRAQVDQARRTLRLTGNVRVVAEPTPARRGSGPIVLTCQSMTYADGDRIIRASGNVKIAVAQGELRVTNELWANPELTRIGSPDLYRASQP